MMQAKVAHSDLLSAKQYMHALQHCRIQILNQVGESDGMAPRHSLSSSLSTAVYSQNSAVMLAARPKRHRVPRIGKRRI